LIVLLLSILAAANSANLPDESWNYVNVRPNAFMFWWLYGSQNVATRDAAPIVIWLQGGPGGSGTGFGNFLEIGPLQYLENSSVVARATPWNQNANLLFIDNPVGTGFSYVTDDSAFTTDEDMIANDLLTCLIAFYKQYPALVPNPLYIFSESYGGKMASSFAKALHIAILGNKIKSNFRAVALGDSWISPIDFVNAWGPYLMATSEIDANGLKSINAAAASCQDAVNKKQWAEATNLWGDAENAVEDASANVNFYNILDRSPGGGLYKGVKPPKSAFEQRIAYHLGKYYFPDLSAFMNGPIRDKLKIIPDNVTWGGQAGQVFEQLSVDFMQSVIPTVDYLLKEGVNVVVYSGNLDLICCTPATLNWMQNLTWVGMKAWNAVPWSPLYLEAEVVAFSKNWQNIRFYEILASGHMVPTDQPGPAMAMLDLVLSL